MKRFFIFLICCLQIAVSVGQNKKPLSLADYGKWNRIGRAGISGDGQWVAYGVQPNAGEDTLFLRHVQTDSLRQVKFANNPVFSDDSKWVTYFINPSKAEAKKAREARRELNNTFILLNLKNGTERKIDRVSRASFSSDGRYLTVLKRKSTEDKSKHTGTDLILFDLQSDRLLNIGNVNQFEFNKAAKQLAYTVDADGKIGNGLYLVDLTAFSIQALDTDTTLYSGLVWDDQQAHKREWSSKGKNLAVLKGTENEKNTLRENQVLVIRNLGLKNQEKKVFEAGQFAGFPENFVISELGALRFSPNAQQLFLGIKEQEPKLKLSKDSVANVDVWHWKDEMIQTVQIRRANMLRRQTHLGTVLLDQGKFVRLADDAFRNISLSENARYAVARNDRDYLTDVNWGESPADLYRVDLMTGEKVVFAKDIAKTFGYAPDGQYFIYYDGENFQSYDLNANKVTNISQGAKVKFADIDHPYPNANPTYGIAGFTKDRKHVIVNHYYDLWSLALDGTKATNITHGVGDRDEVRLRYVSLDPWEEYIDLKGTVVLSAYGEWNKKSGYFQMKGGLAPQELVYEDRSYGRLFKADYTDKILYTVQSFVDFPDFYVSGTDFKEIKKVTNANPQQAEFAWGSKKLVDYTNSRGIRLQGTLTLPANYEAGKKYPMIVYFYEKMSQNHHSYSMPVYDDRPHISYYASNGYLVLQPDNVYEEGKPGTSALDCITSAVNKVIELGYADPAHIGLQGHSWGGYQSSFILTQTDLFKCVITGAPPTNLESFYNNVYGSTGTNHHGITEIGQLRMGRNVTPWSNREAYQRENPMFHADKIKVPFMILHGTVDGAVDWAQGMEFYNAARRLGKEVIFLSYPGEDHHLANEANAKDFQLRMKQYFDHYLKGTEAPEWMIKGIPNLQKLYDKAK